MNKQFAESSKLDLYGDGLFANLSSLTTARGQRLNDLKPNQNITANKSRKDLIAEAQAIAAELFGFRPAFLTA